ncbi:MAG: RluA family pseudouridine synthase [Leptolyngbya sp. SIO1E4]|nr:RluA family pseudouridine synthase [Leptolyngbya sp. SIO1E4]
MGVLHSLTEFGGGDHRLPSPLPRYWYTGQCPQTGVKLALPRTAQAEAIAQGLMQHLATEPCYQREGKMYGILLVETATGELGILKAFSGLLNGQSTLAGWVPPIPGRAQVALAEAQTLEQLNQLKAALIALQTLPERAEQARLAQIYADRWQVLTDTHRLRKQERDRLRQTYDATLIGAERAMALEKLVAQSQQDGMARRRLKRERDAVLEPLQVAIAAADQQIRELKRQRKALSRQLQAQMHAVYSLTNFAGVSTPLQDLMPTGLPTGTGDCAAPKLLHYAATQQLTPLALAEFWWGPSSGDKHSGQFYGACAERCQPIMGFLLSGLPAPPAPTVTLSKPLPILYQDEVLLVVNKPTGLLSVPGRTSQLQDSVLSRLRCQLTDYPFLKAVHRLDKGTSGLFVLAATPEAHRTLSRQFAQRQVQKTYEAILTQPVSASAGVIDLPLWRNPADRPKQSVDWQRGKPSLTEFSVLEPGEMPRVRFTPHTGRTHQLRVHAAHPQGLNAPILGDSLYGAKDEAEPHTCRLHLHATAIQLTHPTTQVPLAFSSPTPF